jgi:hypothetical protein
VASTLVTSASTLEDRRVDRLIALIEDSFRVREDHDPLYVDVGDHLARIRARQHQVIFGRRGSGKSCLMIHFHRHARDARTLSLYVSADEVKRLSYPDLLIRLLLGVFEGIPGKRRSLIDRILRRPPTPLEARIIELRDLLDQAEAADVQQQTGMRRSRSARASAGASGASASGELSREATEQRTEAFRERKLDVLERHLQTTSGA